VYLHPLDPSVKCRYCGKGALVFVRTRVGHDLYRCLAEIDSSTAKSGLRLIGRPPGGRLAPEG
jgi:hypothetical protein